MDISTFIIAWIIAIMLMSGFSSLWSTLTGHEFREHLLLSHIVTKGSIPSFSTKQWLIGWLIHFAVGALFLACYEVLWHYTGIMRSVEWSLIFGFLIGLLGIIGWMILFKGHKNAPKINYLHYYIHLLFAHLVFSLAAYGVYSYMNGFDF